MPQSTYHTKSETQTTALASRLARTLKGGEILLLSGELGAGKTSFTKALARALGVSELITSPTFVLMHQHRMKNVKCKIKNLIHCDAYRIREAQELGAVGLLDWLGRPDTVTVIEWGEKIKPLLRGRKYQVIQFAHGKKAGERVIRYTSR